MEKLSFVIPCYGSETTIEIVVNEIRETLKQRPEYDYEIILRQFLLLWELCCIKLGNINVCVCISSDINHAQFLSHLQSICIFCSGLFVYLL